MEGRRLRDGKGLKCNAFEMKWCRALIDVVGAAAWRPAVTGTGQTYTHIYINLYVCVCVRQSLQAGVSAARLCNLMQGALAPVTSSLSLLFESDGD